MSKYVPDGAKLLCSKGIKMSRLKVKTQLTDYIYERLKGTYEDKMESNFICPQQSTAGLAMGCAIMLPMAGALTIPSALFTLIGGLIGGTAEAVKGYKAGSEAGGNAGKETGSAAGGAVGGVIGGVSQAVSGAVSGGIDGGRKGEQKGGETGKAVGKAGGEAVGEVVSSMPVVIPVGGVPIVLPPPGKEATKELTGKIGEAGGEIAGKAIGKALGTADGAIRGAAEGGVDGLKQGSETGSGIGGKIGEAIGSKLGGIGGAVGGFLSGFGPGAFKGSLFIPSYLGGLLLHIPPICEFLTVPFWAPFHPKVKINGKFALLEISVLVCGLGGVIKIWMEDLLPHLKKAIMSYAVYYNPDDEATMRKKVEDAKSPKEKEKAQEALLDWLAQKEKSLEYMAAYGIKRIKPTDPALINKMKNKSSGFISEIFSYEGKDENGNVKEVYVMVFKGSDNAIQPKEDWVETNAPQSVGMETEQYKDTEEAARAFKKAYPNQEIEFAGHSKAGGEAALAAAVTEKKASVFNPAGVHDATFKKAETDRESADKYVTSFHNHNGDILNTLQDHTYGLVPQAAGTRVGLDTDIPTLLHGPIEGHMMPNMIETLKNEIKLDPRTVWSDDTFRQQIENKYKAFPVEPVHYA